MRPDMADVIVNTGRKGMVTPKGGHIKWKDRPKQESMHPKIYSKDQSDRLEPVIRFLRSKLGKKWDDVWSEICETNKYGRGDVRKQHLRKHIWKDLVDTTGHHEMMTQGRGSGFYVDEGGLLRERPRRKYQSSKRSGPIEINELKVAAKVNGLWFEVQLKVKPKVKRSKYSYNRKPGRQIDGLYTDTLVPAYPSFSYLLLDKVYATLDEGYWYDQSKFIAVSKRQLSAKEIKELGL